MRGNLLYAIQVIIFTFAFMGYLYFVFKKTFPKSEKVEHLGCSLLISFMTTCIVTVISMCFLESIYFYAWVLFWFINFSMAMCMARIEIKISVFAMKKLSYLEAK